MNKKPRPSSQNKLRYSTSGLYIGLATAGVYASYFTDHVSFQDLSAWSACKDTSWCSIDLRAPQTLTLALATLVTTELFKALCSVSADSSILTVSPQKNPWLLFGVAVPFMLNLVIIYTPIFSDSFGLVALNEQDWMHVLLWSFPIVLIDELQKVIYRQNNTTNY